MYKRVELGDRSITEPVDIPERTLEILREVMAQNRIILEANCRAMDMLGSFKMIVINSDHDLENG